MKLKTATILVGICLIIWLMVSLTQWALFTFDLVSFSSYRWLFRAFGLIQILLYAVPLIIFFFVLNSKQKGQQSGSGHQQDS